MNSFESFIERDDVNAVLAFVGLFVMGFLFVGSWLQ